MENYLYLTDEQRDFLKEMELSTLEVNYRAKKLNINYLYSKNDFNKNEAINILSFIKDNDINLKIKRILE